MIFSLKRLWRMVTATYDTVADNDEKNYDQQEFRIQREYGTYVCVCLRKYVASVKVHWEKQPTERGWQTDKLTAVD